MRKIAAKNLEDFTLFHLHSDDRNNKENLELTSVNISASFIALTKDKQAKASVKRRKFNFDRSTR